MAERAAAYVRHALADGHSVVVDPVAVAEFLYVLNGPNVDWDRPRQAAAVRRLASMPFLLVGRAVILEAITLYEGGREHWVDCYLGARVKLTPGTRFASFDLNVRRLPGVDVDVL